MNKPLIRLENLVKEFDDKTILKSINLYINDGEFLTLLGPSGCGKTTTLRIIGGFETPTNGNVYFDEKNFNNVQPHKRRVNTVFQKYALFTHLNVFENIAFGLRINKVSEPDIKIRVKEMLTLVNLIGYEHRMPSKLSGGEQQRVAIARALANRPKVLLLDEPLGALDLKLRKEMQRELKIIQQSLGITFIYVTHDQEEALSMSDTIVIMNRGIIQQIGSPTDIYNEPKNAFVATFIGESNIIDGIMLSDFLVSFAGNTFECCDKGFNNNENIDVVVRPEDIDIVPIENAHLTGIVTSIVFLGVHYEMIIKTENFSFMVHSTDLAQIDSEVGLAILPDAIHIMKKQEVDYDDEV